MKKKLTFIFISLLLLISLGTNAKMFYDKKRLGSLKEREEILTAAIFDLQDKGFKKSDIQDIETEQDYFLLKGRGEYPYRYIVHAVTKDAPLETKTFIWSDKEKTKVEMMRNR